MRLYTRSILLIAAVCLSVSSVAQENRDKKVVVTGSIQSDILIPQDDEKIGTGKYEGDLLTNTYADVNLQSKYVDAGLRLEYLEHPLPGFEPDFKGWGLGNIYAKLHTENFELTLGNFYEQFGSGFILRTLRGAQSRHRQFALRRKGCGQTSPWRDPEGPDRSPAQLLELQ